MCRKKIFTEEEAKQRQKKSCLKYIKNRYHNDIDFREKKKELIKKKYKEEKKRFLYYLIN